MTQLWLRLIKEEQGQDLIDDGLLAALIAIVAVIAISNVGTALSTSFGNVDASIP